MHFKLISEQDLDCIIKIQHELFPSYSAKTNYREAVSGITDYEYFIVYLDEEPIGITGFYTYPIDAESAWLGWFGIREPYRRKGYGTEVLHHFESLARERGFKYARIYTDRDDNSTAIDFYRSNGYTCETYDNKEDTLSEQYPLVIFSKSLGDYPLVPWNNRNIDITTQIMKERQDM